MKTYNERWMLINVRTKTSRLTVLRQGNEAVYSAGQIDCR